MRTRTHDHGWTISSGCRRRARRVERFLEFEQQLKFVWDELHADRVELWAGPLLRTMRVSRNSVFDTRTERRSCDGSLRRRLELLRCVQRPVVDRDAAEALERGRVLVESGRCVWIWPPAKRNFVPSGSWGHVTVRSRERSGRNVLHVDLC